VVPDGAQPVTFGTVAQQDLGDGQAQQFAVAELGWPTGTPAGFEQLIDGHVQCDDEVVETGVHEASSEIDVAETTPTLGGLVLLVSFGCTPPNTASVI